MKMGEKTGVDIIREMNRDDFYQYIIKGIARTYEFSALIVSGPHALSGQEKDFLRSGLSSAGITHDMVATDYDLTEVAIEIAGRSVTLK